MVGICVIKEDNVTKLISVIDVGHIPPCWW